VVLRTVRRRDAAKLTCPAQRWERKLAKAGVAPTAAAAAAKAPEPAPKVRQQVHALACAAGSEAS
jgi:hypothetical protein